MANRRFLQKFNLYLYMYTVFVILWGAWVRISKSGDGCGESWPLCDGRFIPEAQSIATWFEYFHRATTGIFGLLVVFLLYYVLKHFKSDPMIKRLAILIFFFTITESLIGALLVKLGLVVDNDSFLRLVYMSVHQLNSVLLSGFIGMLYLLTKKEITPRLVFSKANTFIAIAFLVLISSGPLAALSTSLYPSEALFQGAMQDVTPGSHWIIQWRVVHPSLALLISSLVAYIGWLNYKKQQSLAAKNFLKLLFISVLFGLSTLILLYPVWMKLGHLTLTHLLWLSALSLFITSERVD